MTTPTGGSMHDDEACMKLFADTMARLNDINEAQMTSILKIAIAGAETARSIDPSNADGDALIEKVSGLIGDMKSNAQGITGEMGGGGKPGHSSEGKGNILCADMDQALNLAMQNAVSAQESLNQIGMSVLGEAAKMILDAGSQNAPQN